MLLKIGGSAMTTPTTPRPSSSDETTRLFQRLASSNPTRSFRVGMAIGALIALATFLLIVQNGESTSLSWVVWDFSAPLWIFLLLSAVSGALLMEVSVVAWRRGRRLGAERKRARGQLKKLMAEEGKKPAETTKPATGVRPAPAGSSDATRKPDPTTPTTAPVVKDGERAGRSAGSSSGGSTSS